MGRIGRMSENMNDGGERDDKEEKFTVKDIQDEIDLLREFLEKVVDKYRVDIDDKKFLLRSSGYIKGIAENMSLRVDHLEDLIESIN